MAEGTQIIQPGEKEVQGRPSCSLQLPKGRLEQGEGWSLFLSNKQQEKMKQPQVAPEEA